MSMLRPIFSVAGRGSTANAVTATTTRRSVALTASRTFATQSGDDAEPPTALAKLYLEDGTTLTAKSFGCHTSVEGEVRQPSNLLHGNIFVLLVPFAFPRHVCFDGTLVPMQENLLCLPGKIFVKRLFLSKARMQGIIY